MYKSLAANVIACFFVVMPLAAQTILYEKTVAFRPKNIDAVGVGDSVYLGYLDQAPLTTRIWLTADGNRANSLRHAPFASVHHGDSVYFYYHDESRKNGHLISVRELSGKSDAFPATRIISFPGDIVGTYVHAQKFYIIWVDSETRSLVVEEIDRRQRLRTHRFSLDASMANMLNEDELEFYSEDGGTNALMGLSKTKLFQYGDSLHLVIDYQRRDASAAEVSANRGIPVVPGEEHRPHVLITTLNLSTDVISTSVIRGTSTQFRSYLLDKKIFIANPTKQGFHTRVYDLVSQEMIAHDSLPATTATFPVYFRYGRRDIITHRAHFKQMVGDLKTTTPTIYVEKVDGKYVIQYGCYYNQAASGGIVVSLNPIVMIAGSIIYTAVLQAMEKPGVHRYYHIEYDGDKTFSRREVPASSLKENIDQFEVANAERVKFKTYVNYKKGVVGIYYVSKESKLLIVSYP